MRNETPEYHSLENLSCLSVTTGKAGVAERVVLTVDLPFTRHSSYPDGGVFLFPL